MVARKKDVSRGQPVRHVPSRDRKKGDDHPPQVGSDSLSLASAIDAIAEGVIIRDENGEIIDCNPSAERILGLSIDEMRGHNIFDPSWEGIHEDGSPFPPEIRPANAALSTGQPQLNVVIGFRKSNGVLWLSLSTYPVFHGSKTPSGLVTSFVDITERKKVEARHAMEHTVTRLLAEADMPSEVIPKIIQTICETLGCACGAYWSWDDRDQLLHCTETWSIPSPEMDEFILLTRQSTNAPDTGGGLIRRTWTNRKATWITDVTQDPSFRRGPLAAKAGLHAALGFPILAQGEALGVIEIFSRDSRQPDEVLIQSVYAIASQIGQFLQRKRAEERLRRFRAAMDVSADIVLLIDPVSMRYVDVNDAACRALGYSREELLAMGPLDILPNSREELTKLYDRLIAGDLSESAAEILFRRKDGSRFTVESFRRAVPSGNGHVIVAVARDIGERKRADQLLKLEHKVTRALAETDSVAGALKAAIRAVCETEGWECGRYFIPDEKAGVMRFGEAWGVQNAAIERYIAGSHDITYPPGVGLMGRAWQTGQPLWVSDLYEDPRASQAPLARESGIHGAFVFPLMSEGKAIGVLAFNSREIREPEERLLQTIGVIGSQIGQFLQRKRAEEALRQANQARRALIETSPLAIFTYDLDGIVTLWNPAAERVYGWTEAEAVGRFLPAVKEDKKEEFRQLRDKTIRGESLNNVELTWERRDGVRIHVRVSIAPLYDADRKLAGIMALSADISARKQAEARQAMEHAITSLLAESITTADAMPKIIQTICETLGWDYGGYWGLDEQTQLVKCVATWNIASIDTTELLARTQSKVLSLQDLQSSTREGGLIRRIWRSGAPVWIEDISKETRSNLKRALLAAELGLHSVFAFPILVGREIIGVMEFFSHSIRQPDETLMEIARSIGIQIGQFRQRKQAEEKIQYLAYYDGLTGLPNRILFNQRLNHALTQARRYKKPLAVLFIDLDRFKNINDTLGHEAGDRLLQEMATRLKGCLRESDTVARLGGDEFVILLEDVVDPKHAANVARKIIGTALNAFTLAGAEYHITASVGISVYPEDGEDEQTLMKHADIAMYLAKDHGKNNYQFYSTQINAHSFERLALESSLRRALERKEFLLHYQAKVDLDTGRVTGMEALIRWQHVDLGMVSPALFIPLAEETGLIVPIGRWVLKTACAQNRAWQDQGLPRLRISVNLSARQFNDDHLMEDVAQALKETGLDPELLELEITESMVMYNPDKAVKLLSAFKAMGVYLAIDDFGIGYSSLAHLKRFPIDTIKVDRSFIKDIIGNREDAAITQAIIAMGKSLNLNVIAEGVETNDQVNFLRDHKCDEMQGFYFSKPVSNEEFAELLRKGTGLVQKAAS